MNTIEQRQKLEQLLLSDDFAELGGELNKFNTFKVLKLENAEIRHSNFLGWLLTPYETHLLGDDFLKELLKIALKGYSNNPNISLKISDIIFNDFSDLEVRLEKMTDKGRRIDIFMKSKQNDFVCVIENKIWSGEGNNQLEDYEKYINAHNEYSSYKHKLFIFLTPNTDYDCAELYKNYIRIDYGMVCRAIDKLLTKENGIVYDNVRNFIRDYKEMVERNIMGNTDKEIVDLCRRIYRENKYAIDLIIENNDYRADALSAMEKVIKSRTDLQEIEGEKDGILALPNNLTNLNQLKYGEWTNDNIVYIHFISFAQGHRDACVEILVAPPKNADDNDKKSKMLAKIEEKTGLKFRGKDWNYTKPFNILTYEDCLNYENEEELKAHVERKMEELKTKYIDGLRDALNEL